MLYVSKMNRGIKSTPKSGCELEWTDAFPRYTIGLLRHGNVAHWGWDAESAFAKHLLGQPTWLPLGRDLSPCRTFRVQTAGIGVPPDKT
jgi:hypothetical protein